MLTTLSGKGQVVIPQAIREKFNLQTGDNFIIAAKNDIIILKKIKVKGDFEDLYKPIKKIVRKIEKEFD